MINDLLLGSFPDEADGGNGGGIDVPGRDKGAQQVAVEMVLPSQDMEVEVAIPELSTSEMEVRRRAVTLREVDCPKWVDDWDSTLGSDVLPQGTVDQLLHSEDLLAVPEADTFLQEDGSVMIPGPPVRPTAASDPRLSEETPTLQEEKRKRPSRQPAPDIEMEEDINPAVMVDIQPQDEDVNLVPVDIAPVDVGADNSVIQPPAAEEEPASFQLPDVSVSIQSKPPKKKRKTTHFQMDEVKSLPGAVIKEQVAKYKDTLREEDIISQGRSMELEQLFHHPGRGVRRSPLDRIWTQRLTEVKTLNDVGYDWSELLVDEEEVPERVEFNVPDQDVTDDASVIRDRAHNVMEQEAVPEMDHLQVPGLDVPDDVSAIREGGQTVMEQEEFHAFGPSSPRGKRREAGEDGSVLLPSIQISSPEKDGGSGLDQLHLPVNPEDGELVQADVGPLQDFLAEGGPVLADVGPLQDLPSRPDDSVDISPVLDHIDSMFREDRTKDLASVLELVGPVRKDVAKMFRQLLVLEKKEVIRMVQDPEDFYGATTVTRL